MLTQIYEITSAQEAGGHLRDRRRPRRRAGRRRQLSARAASVLRGRDSRCRATSRRSCAPCSCPRIIAFVVRSVRELDTVDRASGRCPGAGHAGACPRRSSARFREYPVMRSVPVVGSESIEIARSYQGDRGLPAAGQPSGERQADRGARHHARLGYQPADRIVRCACPSSLPAGWGLTTSPTPFVWSVLPASNSKTKNGQRRYPHQRPGEGQGVPSGSKAEQRPHEPPTRWSAVRTSRSRVLVCPSPGGTLLGILSHSLVAGRDLHHQPPRFGMDQVFSLLTRLACALEPVCFVECPRLHAHPVSPDAGSMILFFSA